MEEEVVGVTGFVLREREDVADHFGRPFESEGEHVHSVHDGVQWATYDALLYLGLDE